MGTGCIYSCPWTALCYDPAQGASPSPSPCPPGTQPHTVLSALALGFKVRYVSLQPSFSTGSDFVSISCAPRILGTSGDIFGHQHEEGVPWASCGQSVGCTGPSAQDQRPTYLQCLGQQTCPAGTPDLGAPPPRVCGRGPLTHRAQASKLAMTPALGLRYRFTELYHQ